jgi:hypothetical protein
MNDLEEMISFNTVKLRQRNDVSTLCVVRSDDLSKKVANALPHAKLCDTEHCVKQTCSCTMKLCSIHDALLGHCTSGRAQGMNSLILHFTETLLLWFEFSLNMKLSEVAGRLLCDCSPLHP